MNVERLRAAILAVRSVAVIGHSRDVAQAIADEYARLADANGDLIAGHRTTAPHDCFTANCRALGSEVERLNEALANCAEQLDISTSGTYNQCSMEGVHEHGFRGPHRFREWYP